MRRDVSAARCRHRRVSSGRRHRRRRGSARCSANGVTPARFHLSFWYVPVNSSGIAVSPSAVTPIHVSAAPTGDAPGPVVRAHVRRARRSSGRARDRGAADGDADALDVDPPACDSVMSSHDAARVAARAPGPGRPSASRPPSTRLDVEPRPGRRDGAARADRGDERGLVERIRRADRRRTRTCARCRRAPSSGRGCRCSRRGATR